MDNCKLYLTDSRSIGSELTVGSEMAAGRNRNKIYTVAVGCFWKTAWVTVFTLTYLVYHSISSVSIALAYCVP